MRNLTVSTLIALAGFSTVAVAQESAAQARQDSSPSCLCSVAANGQAGGPIARLSDIEGQVLRADSAGYTPVKSEVELSAGDRVVLLGEGKATLTAGATCRASLTPGSTVSIDADGKGAACISQSVRVEPTADLPPPPRGPVEQPVDVVAPNYIPALAGVAVVGGGIAAFLLLTDDDGGGGGGRDRPVSP